MARRFDRKEGRRIPYMSVLTALDASDHETRSYLEIAEFLQREGSKVNEDPRQLWRRIVFDILVSNTDDHLRNHGFLREPNGWRLAPAYDLNPMPTDVKLRVHALAIDEIDGTASLDTAFRIAPMFGMAEKDTRALAAQVGVAVEGGVMPRLASSSTRMKSSGCPVSSSTREGLKNSIAPYLKRCELREINGLP